MTTPVAAGAEGKEEVMSEKVMPEWAIEKARGILESPWRGSPVARDVAPIAREQLEVRIAAALVEAERRGWERALPLVEGWRKLVDEVVDADVISDDCYRDALMDLSGELLDTCRRLRDRGPR